MFSVVFTVCVMAAPMTCDHQAALLPPQGSFSECLDQGRRAAVFFSRQHRDRRVTQILCRPAAPGQGR